MGFHIDLLSISVIPLYYDYVLCMYMYACVGMCSIRPVDTISYVPLPPRAGLSMKALPWSVCWRSAIQRRTLSTCSEWLPSTTWVEAPTACPSLSHRRKHVSWQGWVSQLEMLGCRKYFPCGKKWMFLIIIYFAHPQLSGWCGGGCFLDM